MIKKYLIYIILFSGFTFGQYGTVKGTISDSNGNPLQGANVIISNTVKGTSSDGKGYYEIYGLEPGFYTLKISMLGYKQISFPVIIVPDITLSLDFRLEETVINSEQVVVTANKYESKIEDLPVSAELISTEEISRKNITRIDDALRYAPGVNVVLDQVSIRGSSGYSRGAGTRVLVAVDGLPMYSGDSGEIVWQMIPPSEIDKVEIIKGAGSSLYGSTAIGGVINIITRSVPSQPVTFVRTYAGIYDNPAYAKWKWSEKTRTFSGINISHSNHIGDLKFSASLGRTEDMGYKQGDWSKKYYGFLKAEYNFDQYSSLMLLSNGYVQNYGTFNYWENLHNALIPPEADQNQRLPSSRMLTGLIFNHITGSNFSYKVRLSHVYGFWKDESASRNNSKSNLLREEIQTNWKVSEITNLISGIESSQSVVRSNIFGNPGQLTFAVYSQCDFSLLENLNLTGGLRADFSRLDKMDFETSLSPKFGINYKPAGNTILRASVSRGFRAPSLAEAFTSTVAGNITVSPNPQLKSESNLSFETGIKQKINDFAGIDLALFNNEYYDMIEPFYNLKIFEIQFQNITRARIQGIEAITDLDFPDINSTLKMGYTYLNTKNLMTEKALKYRPKNMVDISADYTPGVFYFGADFRYWSRVEEIDDELVRFVVPDGDKRVEVFVLDFRTGVNLFKYGIPGKIFINLKNALNYNYVEMIGNIAPVRNISLNLETVF